MEQSEDEVLVDLNSHLLHQKCEIFDVENAIRVVLDTSEGSAENWMRLHLLASLWYYAGID